MTEALPDLLGEFNKKIREINDYFKLVKFLDNKLYIEEFTITEPQFATLKANCYLLLYNLIEGSIFSGINSIFIDINRQNVSFDKLNDKYKQKWLNYTSALVSRDDKKTQEIFGKKLTQILNNIAFFSILDFKDKEGTSFQNYASYLKTQNTTDFSGTIDIRLIRDTLAPLYGFATPDEHYDNENKRLNKEDKNKISEEGKSFLKVKNLRNKLAHGEITFADAARQDSIDEIRKTRIYIVRYLRILLKNIDIFIEEQGYLKNP